MDWDDEYDLQVAGGMGVGPPIPAPIFNRDDAAPQPHPQPPLRQQGQLQRDQDNAETQTPLEQLTRHWMNERHAPDILPSQELLLASVLDHIRRQVSCIVSCRGLQRLWFAFSRRKKKMWTWPNASRFPLPFAMIAFLCMPGFPLSFPLLHNPHTPPKLTRYRYNPFPSPKQSNSSAKTPTPQKKNTCVSC